MALIAGSAFLKIIPDLSSLGPQLQSAISGGMAGIGKSLTGIGKTMTVGLTLPLAAIGVAAVKASTDFDLAFSRIEGLVGVGADELARMKQAVLDLAPAVGRGPQELADALYFITSSGIKGAEALNVLEISARAATAGLGDTEVVADALTSALNAYGPANLSAAAAADIMVAAVREGKIEADQLTQHMGTLIPTAAALNISFADVAGTLAVLSRTGTDAAEGATQISAVMSSLLSTSPKVTKALKSVGLSQAELRKTAAGPDGLIGVMRLLDKAFGGNVEAMRQVFPNVRAFRAVMNGLAQDGKTVDGVMRGVKDATGALDKAFAAAEKTGRVKFDKAMASIKSTLITLGGIIAPFVASFLTGFAKVAALFATLSPGVQKVIVVVAAVIAALGPIILIVGSIITAITSMVPVFAFVFGVIGTILSAVSLPVLAIAAVVVAVVIIVIKNWETLKRWTITAFNAVKDFLAKWWPYLLAIFTGGISLIVGLVIQNWTTIKNVTATIWNGIKAVLSAVWNFIKAAVTTYFNIYKTIITGVWNAIRAVSVAVWNGIKAVVVAVWNALKASASTVFNAIKTVITTVWNTIKSVTTGVWSAITGAVRTAWNTITSIIRGAIDAVMGPINALKNAVGWLLPGSPIPFVVGLEKSAAALRKLGAVAKGLPGLSTGVDMAGPRVAGGGLIGATGTNGPAGAAQWDALRASLRDLEISIDQTINLDGREIQRNSDKHRAFAARGVS